MTATRATGFRPAEPNTGVRHARKNTGKTDIKHEANVFAANLLMPNHDFRDQADRQPLSFDLMNHCAERVWRIVYGSGAQMAGFHQTTGYCRSF